MFSNVFIIDDAFLSDFPDKERELLSNYVYKSYRARLKKNTKPLPKDAFFSSKRTKYISVYFMCPKCKESYFISVPNKGGIENEIKYCSHCGAPSISHRYKVGEKKILSMLHIAQTYANSKENEYIEIERSQNQQILVLICSVLEVYLREFYADILNMKYVLVDQSLYGKFLRDCKNDFLNPGKTQERLKKELNIDYKSTIGNEYYKIFCYLADARNTIVHNNGICDDTFIKKYPKVEIRAEIAPQLSSLAVYANLVGNAIGKLDIVYQQELRQSIKSIILQKIRVQRFDTLIENDDEFE